LQARRLEATRPLADHEALEAMELAWPGYFSSLGGAAHPQTGHAPSDELGLNPRRATVPGRTSGCTVPTRFVHGA
jgi:hypothetical protein